MKKKIVTEAGIDVEEFDIDQIHELAKGLQEGLSPEQVRSYADPGLSATDTFWLDPDDLSTWFPTANNTEKTWTARLGSTTTRDIAA